MKRQQQPMGKLGLSPRLEPHLLPLEPQIKRNNRHNLANKLIDSKNKVLEGLGKGLRSAWNTIDVDRAKPTRNNQINRRAGRTALAGIVLLGSALAFASFADNPEKSPENCTQFYGNDFGYEGPVDAVASLITEEQEAASSAPDRNSDLYDNNLGTLLAGGTIEACGPLVDDISERYRKLAELDQQ